MGRCCCVVVLVLVACGGGDGGGGPDGPAPGDDEVDAAVDAAPPLGNRDRLLVTYLAFLQTRTAPQSNGLDGAEVSADVCALWTRLDPSSRDTFLTLTARLDGARLADGSAALDHATRLYRVTGGDGATATDPGGCGGAEYNRAIVAIDPALHAAIVAANANQGAPDATGHRDLADIPIDGFWRDSHDLGGTHDPFDLSNETDDGAPRGQLQVFADPASAPATAALGRVDLDDVVEPYAMEIDQDFDCFHNSNPSCAYTLYGPACAPMTSALGTAIFVETYGDYEPAWRPVGCD